MIDELETHTPIIGELRRHKNATGRGTPPSYPDPSQEPSDLEPTQKDSTNMIIDETTEPSAAPFSQPTIDELRAVANAQTSPARRQLLNLLIDIQQAERDAHHAQVNGDSEAETMAIFARCKAKGELEEYYDELADVHNTGFTWALRRTPQVLGPLIQSALGVDLNKMQADIAKNSADIVELAEECVRLKGGAI